MSDVETKPKKGKSLLTGQSNSRLNTLTESTTRKFLNGKITAKRVVISSNEIENKTDVHYLNPRNQEALNYDAVRDILPSIEENGVHQEGVAVRCTSSNKLLLLDSSRRRFCCIEAGADLPLWELQNDVEDKDLLSIINDSQEVKRWSYPEHASYLLKIAEFKGIDVKSTRIEILAEKLSIGRESLRKRLEANKISINIRKLFIDYEGIPNSFYSKLAKLQRDLEASKKDITEVVTDFSSELKNVNLSVDVHEAQQETLALLTQYIQKILNKKKNSSVWTTTSLGKFENKNAFAKMSKSSDGHKIKFEFSRSLTTQKKNDLERFIRELLQK